MLALEYSNDSSHYLTMHRLLNPDVPLAARHATNQSLVLWTIVLLCGVYLAYVAKNIPFIIAFVVFLCTRIYDWATYPARYWTSIDSACQRMSVKSIQLRVDADGLHETVSGIESFAPWKSVKSYVVFREILFVELVVGLWSIIPTGTLSSTSSTIEQVVEALAANGVAISAHTGVA